MPDPSALSTEALEREISHLRELLESQIAIVSKDLDNFKTGLEDRYNATIKDECRSLKEQTDIQITSLAAVQNAATEEINKRYEHRYKEILHLIDLSEGKASQLHQETDLRYQQRYDAQSKALVEKDQVQQVAIQAALDTAEKGVQAALANVDKATVKFELGLHERFTEIERSIDRRFANEEIKLNTALASVDKATITASGVTLHRFELIEHQVGRISMLSDLISSVSSKLEGLDRLTDSKFVTLRTLVDTQAEKVALALTASDRAIGKAETSADKRSEDDRRVVQQLQEQAKSFVSRSESLTSQGAMADKITSLEKQLAGTIPRQEAETRWKSLEDTSTSRWEQLTKQVTQLALDTNKFTSSLTGGKEGQASLVAWVIAAISVVSGIIAIVIVMSGK